MLWPPTRPQPSSSNGTDLALCRGAQDDYYALSNRCPHRLGQIGDGAVEAMRTTRAVPNFDALQFRPAQLAHLPLLDSGPVSLAVELGGRSAQPLHLDMLALISHMSFGAISREAKVALARV